MASGKRRQTRGERHGIELTPMWVVALVSCGLLIFIVVKKVDDITEVSLYGGSVGFQKLPPQAIAVEEQRERSHDIEERLEQEVRAGSGAQGTPAVDLSGVWATLDGTASWSISFENGFFVFREQSQVAPGLVSSAGYGPFDGRTWSLQFQTIAGDSGTAVLNLEDERSLRGEGVVSGSQFAFALRR